MRSAVVSLLVLAGGTGFVACGSFGAAEDSEVETVDAASSANGDASTSEPLDGSSPSDDAGVEAGPAPQCPTNVQGPRLVYVAGVCIDETEVTVDQYRDYWTKRGSDDFRPGICQNSPPNDGQEVGTCKDRPGRMPVACVSWCDAIAYCAWAGKRLCGGMGGSPLAWADRNDSAKNEWMRVCTNLGTQLFPTGTSFVRTGCNVRDNEPVPAGPVAADVGCEGTGGVKHLSGNVGEWSDSCDGAEKPQCGVNGETWKFRESTTPGACNALDKDSFQDRFEDLGIRCCATPIP